jgi:uncharacterized protein (DUF1330 family)
MLRKLISFALAVVLFGSFGAQQAKAQEKAYVIVHIQVDDFDRYFAEYIPGVVELFGKHGGHVLVATGEPDSVEGELSGNWHVVVEFPSMDAAKAWYEDADYLPLRDLRMNELTAGGSLSFVSAFKPHS